MKRCGEPMPAGALVYACRNLADHEGSHTVCGTTDHPHGSTPCTTFGDLIESTPMLDAVTADLAELDITTVPGGRSYRATALWLASVIDKRGEDDGPSTTAKLADQLSKVMAALTKAKAGSGAPDGFEKWQDSMSTPAPG